MIMRILLGCVFIFSGLTKAFDPVATSYTFDGYFFSFYLSFLQIFSTFAAFVMPIIELALGVMMLARIQIKLTSLLYLIMMSFFLLLTAWLALSEHMGWENVVKDCGCFGTAIKLSNLQTFIKNVIIIIPTIIVYMYRKRIPETRLTQLGKVVVLGICCLSCLIMEAHFYRHLPASDTKLGNKIHHWLHKDDYDTWAVGTDLTKYYIGQDEIRDKAHNFFLYKNPTTGDTVMIAEQEMNDNWDAIINQYPWIATATDECYIGDTTDTTTVILQPEIKAKNFHFTITDTLDQEMSKILISHDNPFPVYLLCMYDLDQVNSKGLKSKELQEIIKYCEANQCYFYGLTESPREEADKFVKDNNIKFEILCSFSDPAHGITYVRDAIHSNPGIIRIERGVITGKWAWRDFDEVLGK